MTQPGWHLAQVNVARMLAPLDDPLMVDFERGLEGINALADASPGFLWRLQTEEGDATAIQAFDDERMLVNLSLWASLDALRAFVYRSDHSQFLRRRGEWFERPVQAAMALWWVSAGHEPDVVEAQERLERLQQEGPGPQAFTFGRSFAPPESQTALK